MATAPAKGDQSKLIGTINNAKNRHLPRPVLSEGTGAKLNRRLEHTHQTGNAWRVSLCVAAEYVAALPASHAAQCVQRHCRKNTVSKNNVLITAVLTTTGENGNAGNQCGNKQPTNNQTSAGRTASNANVNSLEQPVMSFAIIVRSFRSYYQCTAASVIHSLPRRCKLVSINCLTRVIRRGCCGTFRVTQYTGSNTGWASR